MRIAIPSNDGSNLVYHLKFATGFMIYDIVNGQIQNQFYRNLNQMSIKDEENILISYNQIIESLTDSNLIILYAMNSEIKNEFNKAGKDIFLTSVTNLKGAVDLFLQGRLINMSLDNSRRQIL